MTLKFGKISTIILLMLISTMKADAQNNKTAYDFKFVNINGDALNLSAYQNKVIVSSDPYLYILNSITGSTISKIAISSLFKPIVSGKNIF